MAGQIGAPRKYTYSSLAEKKAVYAKVKRERRAADPEGVRAKETAYYHRKGGSRCLGKYRRATLWSRYRVTPEWFEKTLRRQRFRCALCGTGPLTHGRGFTRKTAHIDHDHRSGQARRILCSCCNRGLGFFHDSPRLLRKAAAYIKHFNIKAC